MIDDKAKANAFNAVFYEAIGGADVAAMLCRFHIEGASQRTIASEFGITQASVCTRMARARTTLRRLGLMPIAWEKPPQAILEPPVGLPKK